MEKQISKVISKIIQQEAKVFFERLEGKILSEPINPKDYINRRGFEIIETIKNFQIITKRHDYLLNGKPAHNYWTYINNPYKNFNIPENNILNVKINKQFKKALETHFKAIEYLGKI